MPLPTADTALQTTLINVILRVPVQANVACRSPHTDKMVYVVNVALAVADAPQQTILERIVHGVTMALVFQRHTWIKKMIGLAKSSNSNIDATLTSAYASRQTAIKEKVWRVAMTAVR